MIHQAVSCFTHKWVWLFGWGGSYTEGKGNRWTDRQKRGENNSQSGPVHPCATQDLSKECRLLNSIPALKSYEVLMQSRWEMEEKQRSEYAFHISCLNEKNCQESLIAFLKVSHPQCGIPTSAVGPPLQGSGLDYHKQTLEGEGSHPTSSPIVSRSTTLKMKGTDFRSMQNWVQILNLPLLVWLSASYLASLGLSFLIHKDL